MASDDVLTLKQELRKTQARLRAIIETEPQCVKVVDRHGVVLEMNPAGLAMLGAADSAEVIGRRVLDFIHPDDADAYRLLHERVIRGAPGELQFRVVSLQGESRWVASHSAQLQDPDGAAVAALSVTRDISRRRAAETAMRASEERFRRIFTSAATGIAMAGADGRLIDANQAFCEMLGYSVADLVEQDLLTLTHPDDRPRLRAHAAEVLDGFQASVTFELRCATRTAETIWCRMCLSAPRDDSGSPVGILAMAENITQQKVAEDGLERSQALLRMASKVARMGGWSLDLATGRILCSDAVCEMHGFPPGSSPKSEEALESYAPEHRDTLRRAVAECIRFGTPFDLELQLVSVQKRRTWVRCIAESVRNSEGRCVRLDGALLDISQRVQAEADVRESEERFRLLSRATNDAIWDWNLLTNELWWNEGIEVLFGYSRAELEWGIESWTLRIHPEDHDRVVNSIHAAIRTGEANWSAEYRFRRADGRYAYVLDRGHVIRDSVLGPVRMIGGITDLTAWKEVEVRLREQAALLDAAHEAILVRDLSGRVIYWNRGAEGTYGWTAEEALGRSVEEILYADPQHFRTATAATFFHGEWVGELEQLRRDGTRIIAECRWTLIREPSGTPKSILAINTDITERKRLEQQFLRAQRLENLGTLAGGIAHDLNNVLAPVLMSVELLQILDQDPERLELLSTIQTSAQRGADMVRQVLSFARGVDGSRIPVDLRAVVTELEHIVRETFPKNVALRVITPETLWGVIGDPTQLHQVMMNLAVNARDAMPEGGVLSVCLSDTVIDSVYAGMNRQSRPGAYILMEIADTGTGIPLEIQERIFDPFFTTKEVGQGTGLGLSTTLAIVRSHGGFINAYSEPGKGATFKVYLPAQVGADSLSSRKDEPSLLPRGNGELVLVVDDEESIREVVRRTLERFGYRVLLAEHGADAIDVYVQRPSEIALVLTDMMMPVLDGPATISALRAINPRVLIVGSSGLDAPTQVVEAMGLGAAHFVSKPYTAETLLRVIHTALYLSSETGCSKPPGWPVRAGG